MVETGSVIIYLHRSMVCEVNCVILEYVNTLYRWLWYILHTWLTRVIKASGRISDSSVDIEIIADTSLSNRFF